MDDDLDFMDDLPSLDEYDPEDVDVEVLNVFPFGTDDVFATVQLSDNTNEAARSYLLKVRMGRNPSCRVILRIEDLLLSHVSLSVDDHVALQVGGVTHHLSTAGVTIGQGPEPFTNKLWALDGSSMFLFGEGGTICHYDKGAWLPMGTGTEHFIRAMHGPTKELIHAGGDHGTLLRLVGNLWEQQPVDFGDSIMAVHSLTDGTVLFSCELGDCGMIRQDEKVLVTGAETPVTSIQNFLGMNYWGDQESGIYRQTGTELVLEQPFGPITSMQASGNRMAVSGWRHLFDFDGKTWRGVEFGFDGDLMLQSMDLDAEFR